MHRKVTVCREKGGKKGRYDRMYCIKGCEHECDGCGRCTQEESADFGAKDDADCYSGAAYRVSCAQKIIKKRSSK